MNECAWFLPAKFKFTQRKHDVLHARRLFLRNLAQITPSSQISFTDGKQTKPLWAQNKEGRTGPLIQASKPSEKSSSSRVTNE